MSVLAKPSNIAIVIPVAKKDEFLDRSKKSDSFGKLMERSSKATSDMKFEWCEGHNAHFKKLMRLSCKGCGKL